MNAHETAARAQKAQKLVDVLDGVLRTIGVTSYEEAYDRVCGMPEQGWISAATVAGVNTPSEETRQIVISCFRRRVEAQASAVAACIAAIVRAAAREPAEVE